MGGNAVLVNTLKWGEVRHLSNTWMVPFEFDADFQAVSEILSFLVLSSSS